jgi:UTP--glucose-1-phosphate uridylyltransferase
VGDEPFAVILADDLIDAKVPVMKQMTELYEQRGSSVLAVQTVAREETASYGIVSSEDPTQKASRISGIVEKPKPEDAPSTLAVVGRYVLTPRVFDYLASTRPGAGREIQLTDAIGRLLRDEEVLAYQFTGKRYDCGTKLGYLEATVEYGLKHPDLADDFRAFLQGLAKPAKPK